MKDELRKKYLLVRNNIISKDIKDEIIFNKVINDEKVKNAQSILIYMSIGSEVDTSKLINYFLKFKKVAVPKIENNTMNFYFINSVADLKKGTFSILEPITKNRVTSFSNAVCITPGICFDKFGYRIGYGKGYYDRFFSKNDIYSIGLCYKECLIDDINHDVYDKFLDKVITD